MTDRELLEKILAQTQENTDMIKDLLHRTDELDAKYDGLLYNVASKTDIARVEDRLERIEQIQKTQGESINILALRQLQTESEIAALKKAK